MTTVIRTPEPAELLAAWDEGAGLPPLRRSGPLLRAATGLPPGELAALSVGERDRQLVRIRQRLFGETLRSSETCPACGVMLELELATGALLATAPGPAQIEVRSGDHRLTCRALRAADLEEAARSGSLDEARHFLVRRSIRSAERAGQTVAVTDLPAEVVAAVAAALSDADPLTLVELPIRCDECGAGWSRTLDVDAFLWAELDAWAWRLLAEIHTLASAYGWTEPQILALSPRRRRRYLELAGHG